MRVIYGRHGELKRKLKGSFTIEMSFLIPIILFIFMGLVLTVFYYHDKDIMHGAAYETAVLGSVKMRGKEEITEAELESFCRDRLKGKCIFMTSTQISVDIQEEEIVIGISSRKKGFALSIEKRAALTEPEKKIRDIRRLDIKNGETNHD